MKNLNHSPTAQPQDPIAQLWEVLFELRSAQQTAQDAVRALDFAIDALRDEIYARERTFFPCTDLNPSASFVLDRAVAQSCRSLPL
jgi:hypothetical protein